MRVHQLKFYITLVASLMLSHKVIGQNQTVKDSTLKDNFVDWGTTKLYDGGGRYLRTVYPSNYVILVDFETHSNGNSDGRYPITVKWSEEQKKWKISYTNSWVSANGPMVNYMVFKSCERAFNHVTNKSNSEKYVTTLDYPYLNGNNDLILLVTKRGEDHNKIKNHGVFFNETINKWQIYSLAGKKMEADLTFSVLAISKNDDLGFYNKKDGLEISFQKIALNNGSSLPKDFFENRNSRYIKTFNTLNTQVEDKVNVELRRDGSGHYWMSATTMSGQHGSIPKGYWMNVLRINMSDSTLKEVLKTEEKNLKEDLIIVYQQRAESTAQNEAMVQNIKSQLEAAKEVSDQRIAAQEKIRQEKEAKELAAKQEAENKAKLERDAVKYYSPNPQPPSNTLYARPCVGKSQKIQFTWDALDQAEGYKITCNIKYRNSQNGPIYEKLLFENTVNSNSYEYSMDYSEDTRKLFSMEYSVQAMFKNELFPNFPQKVYVNFGDCLESTTITTPAPYSNAMLENKREGGSIWDFAWKSIDNCDNYEIELYVLKNNNRIDILTPTNVYLRGGKVNNKWIQQTVNFAYKTTNVGPIPDRHETLPCRNDQWFVRVRGVRGDLKGSWSTPVRFQVMPPPVDPNRKTLPNSNLAISNLTIKPETEKVTIRHRAPCIARYTVKYKVFQNNRWVVEGGQPITYSAQDSKALPNHTVEIPANAIDVEIIMQRMKLNGEDGVVFYHIRLPRATSTMHYDVLPSIEIGGTPLVVRSEPPVFQELIDLGENEIKKFGLMIGEAFVNMGEKLFDPAIQEELINQIESDQLAGVGVAKFITTNAAESIKDAAQNSGFNFQSMSLSACGGASFIVGGEVEVGVAFPVGDAVTGTFEDLKNVVFYASPSWSTGFSFGADAGISISLWTNTPRNLGGDAKGVVFSYPGKTKTYEYVNKAGKVTKLGTDVTITTWFDSNNNFLGFTLTGSMGRSVSFGKQFVRAYTLVPAEMD